MEQYGGLADGHLWLHFTRSQDWLGSEQRVPIAASGEGCWITDVDGKRYFDGLSALYCAQLGYGRQDLVDAASRQLGVLPFATNWGWAHEPSIELAAGLAERFPGDLDHFFFVNSGSEAVETAMKLAMQYHRLRGEDRWKFISRAFSYHGTTLGALGLTGVPALRRPFEPLRPGHHHVANTNSYRCGASQTCPPCDLACARTIEQAIIAEGADQIAAVFVEPVQNAGGCLTPPPGYLDEVRRVCDEYGVLMVSDEVICGFGRLGSWTGAEHYGYLPDLLTFAKGVTSAYQPLGGVAFRRTIGQVLAEHPDGMFTHGSTWGGHPAATAVGVANLAAFERDNVLEHVRSLGPWLGSQMDRLAKDHPIVGDVRGEGFFWAIELSRDRDQRQPFDRETSTRLLDDVIKPGLQRRGLICRADARDQLVIQIAPPLVASQDDLGWSVDVIDDVLTEVGRSV